MNDSTAANLPSTIAAEADYAAVHAILSKRTGAPSVLRGLMSLFESYRSARKYGWSRPWNKGGLRTFLALEFSPRVEIAYASLAADWTDLAQSTVSSRGSKPSSSLLSALVASSGARGFVFLHERLDAEGLFEGFTLSFGAVSAKGRRYRDRFDVIVEQRLDEDSLPSPVSSLGLSASPSSSSPEASRDVFVRVYEDCFQAAADSPNAQSASPLLYRAVLPRGHVDVAHLLIDSLNLVRGDALDTARHWTHWTQDVIDYFGPRRFPELANWFDDRSFAEELSRRRGAAYASVFRSAPASVGKGEPRP